MSHVQFTGPFPWRIPLIPALEAITVVLTAQMEMTVIHDQWV